MRLRLLAITCSILLALGLTATLAAGPGPGDQPPGADVFVETAPLPDRTGGPDLFGYTFADSAEPNCTPVYVPISTTGTALNLADDGEANVTMPFDFMFYGVTSANLRVGNNGGVRFNATTGDVSNGNLVLPNATHALTFFPYWDDIDADTGNVYYATVGTAPSRQFIVEWYNRPHYSNVGSATFEMILYETTNRIEFLYPDMNFGNATYDNGVSATVGINQDGTNALQYSYNTAGSIPDGLGICWYPPAPGPLYSTAQKSAPIAVVGGEPITYTLYVANTGLLTGTATTIVDPIPAGTTYIAGSVTGGASYNAGLNQIEWSGSIGVGAAVTVTFAVDPAGATCGADIVNTAVISDPTLLMPVSRSATTGVWDAAWAYDFEADNGGFVAGINGGTGGTDWQWGTPTYPAGLVPHSGVNLWATILDGPFNNRGGSSTLTKTFSLPAFASAELSWWQYLKTGNSTFDWGRVFLNSDIVYNSSGVDELVWTNHTADLAPYLGGTLTINFDFYATTVVNNDGWYLDDVAILACAPPSVVILNTSTKTGDASVLAGEQIDYTITLNNTGGVPATGTTLVDPIPAGATYVAGSVTGGGTYNGTLNQIEWTGEVPALGAQTVTFAVTAPTAAANLVNTATISQTTIAAPVVVTANTTVIAYPNVTANPLQFESAQATNVVRTLPLSIGNTGYADLHWSIDEAAGALFVESHLDALGDLLVTTDLGTPSGDTQLLGIEYAQGFWWATGGNSGADPNKFYKFNPDGTLAATYDQPGNTGWGWRDLAFDGTYLYAGDDSGAVIKQIDPATGAPTGTTITCPTTPCRALAYDPATDHFWTANFSSSIWEFSRAGTIVNTFANTLAIYGMAWDDMSTGGPYLWAWSQDGANCTTGFCGRATQINPVTGAATGVVFDGVPYSPGTQELAGGATIVPNLVPGKLVFVGLHQASPDVIRGYELGDTSACANPIDQPWLSATPVSGTLAAAGTQPVDVSLDSTGRADGVYTATLCLNSDDPDTPLIAMPVTMTVRPPTAATVTGVAATAPGSLLPLGLCALFALGLTGAVVALRKRR